MNRKEFQKYLDRDEHCPHCGSTDDTLVPQHRGNKGAGGYKAGNQPANVIVLCSAFNTAIESDPLKAETARKFGWKIGRYVEPTEAPYYDMVSGTWWLLDSFFGRRRAI
jgi:hypothetical protein